jgi:hypothetical protein
MQSLSESASAQLEASSPSERPVSGNQPGGLGDFVYPLVTIAAMLLLLGTLWVF